MIPGIESLACGPLAVPDEVMAHVVQVESSRNPYAIGVVGGRLLRQPRNLGEAVATVRMLEAKGYNYSIGLAQVNRVNFARFGLQDPSVGFDACNNLAAGAKILAECLQRHDGRWGDAFSCYYSGNARTGYEHGYVQKVFAAMGTADSSAAASGPGEAIQLAPAGSAAGTVSRSSASTERGGGNGVLAARLGAPAANRVEPASRLEPVSRIESVQAAPSQPFVGTGTVQASPKGSTIDAVASAKGAASVEATELTADHAPPNSAVATPEARFFEAMRREAEAISASNSPMRDARDRADAPAVPSSIQQSSNSHVSDAARVF